MERYLGGMVVMRTPEPEAYYHYHRDMYSTDLMTSRVPLGVGLK